jgi:signal transduction histidine kinase
MVLDISPNGIMSFKAIRDGQGRIIDFEFLSSNRAANAMVKRDDLVGKRLLREMPENADAGLFEAYCNVVTTGKPFKKEFHYKADGIDSWFANEAVASEDGFVVTFMDVTEQRLAHEVAAESERLALTGQITRTVAHEVRNPLTNIHLAVEQLQDEVDAKDPDLAPFFDIIDRNLKRIGTLIREMLESAKKRELSLVPCAMDDIVKNALKRVADRLALRGMRAIVEVEPDLPQVMADCELIDLAITNLAVNAVEAMEPEKGVLRFTVRRAGDDVLMEITDNGKGIAPEELSRLFEPFYSGRTGGLGLGLTTARSIFHSHQVKLEPRSAVGEGTTFALRFPSRTFVV